MPLPARFQFAWIWLLAGVGVIALGAVIGARWLPGKRQTPHTVDPVAAPSQPASRYLNLGPEVQYVGSEACIGCHANEHLSYQRTGMSRSTVEVDPNDEPPDGVVDHAASQRRFVVHRQGGQLHHRELLQKDTTDDLVLQDFPLKYRVGSGGHARTYLVETEGFLVESPVTWYASRQRWDMSPGFDKPAHASFERPIAGLCLNCHVGRFEEQGGSFHRFQIVEAAIGCERCHGPGSLHVTSREQAALPPEADDAADWTIVNPARLSRELAEAVCQQCHLSGDVTVPAAGRRPTDFRPGLSLADFQHIYSLTEKGQEMTVTGHVAQLHQSRCYQQSATLTCTTCHNPHGFPEPGQLIAHYRAACLQCHAETACRVDPHQRQRKSPENSCIDCHMPTSDTEVPHVSFSHHRIGIHTHSEPPLAPEEFFRRTTLQPFHDQTHLSHAHRERALGLAYGAAGARHEIGPDATAQFNLRAYEILTTVAKAGVRDGPVATTLARTSYRLQLGNTESYAAQALEDPALDGEQRCDMLFFLADAEFRRGEFAAAAARLRELVGLRRSAIDWSYLSKCERAAGNDEAGLRALETAARIGASIPRLQQDLADLYRQQGDPDRAQQQLQRLPRE